ncbi:hypothetical protein FHS96_000213 [Sphingomonas zeicaulis]
MILDAISGRKQKFRHSLGDRPEPRPFGEIAAGLVARLAAQAEPVLH